MQRRGPVGFATHGSRAAWERDPTARHTDPHSAAKVRRVDSFATKGESLLALGGCSSRILIIRWTDVGEQVWWIRLKARCKH